MIQQSAGAPAVVRLAATPPEPLPIPRGVAFLARTAAAAEGVDRFLRLWNVKPITHLDGWFEATLPMPPATGRHAETGATTDGSASRALADFWMVVRALRDMQGVTQVAPLLVLSNPQPATQVAAEAFSMGAGQHQFGTWGAPYDRATDLEIQRRGQARDWHLRQMKVPEASELWRQKFPNELPGFGTRIALLDTGCTSHPRVASAFVGPGRSFLLRNNQAEAEADGRDDLHLDNSAFLLFPGHGTAVASAIAGGASQTGANDETPEVFGVAPGASLMPLRVSRSTRAFDVGAVAEAILAAVDDGVDVISVSVGSSLYSEYVHECIRHAQRSGILVVASAGMAVPATAFPAALPEVVGVAATHPAGGPWRFSGSGRFVDVAAPGEHVWCARASRKAGKHVYTAAQTSSTAIAAGCVAGLAATWLAYHGGRTTLASKYAGRLDLVPLVFKSVLTRAVDEQPWFACEGRYGTGIVDAEKLLRAELPSLAQVERYAEVLREHRLPRLALAPDGLAAGIDCLLSPIAKLDWAAVADADSQTPAAPVSASEAAREVLGERTQEQRVLTRLLGSQAEALGEELLTRIASDRLALVQLRRVQQNESALALLEHLLGAAAQTSPNGTTSRDLELSRPLRDELERCRAREQTLASKSGSGSLPLPVSIVYSDGSAAGQPLAPASRNLRVYAFDPSLDTRLETAPITQVAIRAPWEPVRPGPIGEYLEVIDVDPASGCVYSPLDLDHPHVLAQNGVAPSEGDPQFHQQMVYAVAMNTIQHFERALGRPMFWSPLRPWLDEVPQEQHYFTREALDLMGYSSNVWVRRANWKRERYVQRLRIYPHALREANAYYSPAKRALLFGYFPAAATDTGTHYPGGMVFTCLSHDIIAHETTHAVLDGIHPYFNEPSNEDVWAFHEAFADIVALLQHFTYPDVLRHQIANTRGNLETDNLLAQLAQQFGQATGKRGALRDALGQEDQDGHWKLNKPDPRRLRTQREPHERGGILIAAVFKAFLELYNDRVADLLRIYTGGTGVLPAGQLHPDLINRLAIEAANIAEGVLRICIRAMDYMPPVDPTFGEFLRALITADYDLSPHEGRRNRIAFIDAFRSWGIYPPDVATLSEDSLRWQGPTPKSPLTRLDMSALPSARSALEGEAGAAALLDALDVWQRRYDDADAAVRNGSAPDGRDRPGGARASIFERAQEAQVQLHTALSDMQAALPEGQSLIPGLDLRPGASFSVGNLRPARRIGPQGEYRTEMIVEIVQTVRSEAAAQFPARGGATLVVDLRTWNVRYVIYKRLFARLPAAASDSPALVERVQRAQSAFAAAASAAAWGDDGNFASELPAMYTCEPRPMAGRIGVSQNERFALLHRGVEF